MLHCVSCLILGFFLPTLVAGFFIPTFGAYDNCIEQRRFEKVIIFGDSYSDQENGYKLTNKTWPLSPPYYHGRYCNYRNWVDQLEVREIKNYAYPGATTDNRQVQGYTKFNTIPVPGVNQQIDKYFNECKSDIISSEKTLHIIWVGGNNILFNPLLPIPDIASNLTNLVTKLCEKNAKHVLVFNVQPAQYIPALSTYANATTLTELSAAFNFLVASYLHAIQQVCPQTSINMFDINSLFTKVITQGLGYFKDTTNSCWTDVNPTTIIQNCKDPNKNVFLDNIHVTYPVHQLIADVIQKFLCPSYQVNTASCYIHNA
ncbi:unnamed protein product [Adineta steineri]|uniref:Uncharacterized protein n=1 Tax=Adineta steineri TaxID=433720 RepID=A0A819SAS5_9BILA|nr:unnamed protein product [Adineta steineri]